MKSEEKKPIASKPVAIRVENKDKMMPRKRVNGCHLCGKCGHHVSYCYFRKQQYE